MRESKTNDYSLSFNIAIIMMNLNDCCELCIEMADSERKEYIKRYRAPTPNMFVQSYIDGNIDLLKMSKVCNLNSIHSFAKSISVNLSGFGLFFALSWKDSKEWEICVDVSSNEFFMRTTKRKCERKNATN